MKAIVAGYILFLTGISYANSDAIGWWLPWMTAVMLFVPAAFAYVAGRQDAKGSGMAWGRNE